MIFWIAWPIGTDHHCHQEGQNSGTNRAPRAAGTSAHICQLLKTAAGAIPGDACLVRSLSGGL
jgi:hypothetical protein